MCARCLGAAGVQKLNFRQDALHAALQAQLGASKLYSKGNLEPLGRHLAIQAALQAQLGASKLHSKRNLEPLGRNLALQAGLQAQLGLHLALQAGFPGL